MRLSLVIAAWNGNSALEACLESLRRCSWAPGDEIVVAANFDAAQTAAGGFPAPRILRLPDTATVPELRTAGILQCGGDVIAITEDHFRMEPGWAGAFRKAHESGAAGIGGTIENAAAAGALDWAVYFDDYGPYMPPLGAEPPRALSGANASYKSDALRQLQPTFRDGFFEPFVHGEMLRRGLSLAAEPGAVVYHDKRYRAARALADAYHHGRGYAARRAAQWGPLRRAVFAAGSVILPVLLPARTAAGVLAKGRHLGALARSIPYLVALRTAWAFGEMRGYLAGEGSSAGQWK